MKVRMKEDKQGSPDGINVIDYKKGKTYDIPNVLAEPWIGQKLAVEVKPQKAPETKVEEPDETKVIEPPETKVEAPDKTDEGLKEPEVKAPPEPEKKDKK